MWFIPFLVYYYILFNIYPLFSYVVRYCVSYCLRSKCNSFRYYRFKPIFSLLVLIISGLVIVYSINFICQFDYLIYIMYICAFELFMFLFVLCNDLLISFLCWECIGLISYVLINFWCLKNQCGIKAIMIYYDYLSILHLINSYFMFYSTRLFMLWMILFSDILIIYSGYLMFCHC